MGTKWLTRKDRAALEHVLKDADAKGDRLKIKTGVFHSDTIPYEALGIEVVDQGTRTTLTRWLVAGPMALAMKKAKAQILITDRRSGKQYLGAAQGHYVQDLYELAIKIQNEQLRRGV